MKRSILSSTVAAVAVAIAAAASAPAEAQTLNVARKVSRDELRECLNANDSIKTRSDGLKARSERLNALNEELKTEGEAIRQEIERQERSSSMIGLSRDRLERRRTAYEQKAAAAKADSEKFAPEADALNKDLDSYNQRCGGITYTREDRDAILKEREAATR